MPEAELTIDGQVIAVQTLRLEPDDAIVLTLLDHVPTSVIENIRACVTDLFPGHRIVVLHRAALSVVRS